MKNYKLQTNKKEILIAIIFLAIGMAITYLFMGIQVKDQKRTTARILKNSIKSLEASNELANSCARAYETVTNCVSNLQSCNLSEESKKLDEYNSHRINADAKINMANQELEKIIEEVKTKH